MNNLLELRGKRFAQESWQGQFGGPSMNGKKTVSCEKIKHLINKISMIISFWETENRPFEGILISVHYNKIVAKSNRINGIFKKEKSNDCVVGAKFNHDNTKHIITYYLDIDDLFNTVELLGKANLILADKFNGIIGNEILQNKAIVSTATFKGLPMSQSSFKQVIADVSYIDDFEVEYAEVQEKQSIITIYNTKSDTKKLMSALGIDVLSIRILDEHTLFLDEAQLEILYTKAPYLVSMATVDISEFAPSDFIENHDGKIMTIPTPDNEPTIGVIDTLFDDIVYFNEWVDYYDMVDVNISKIPSDYKHGTAVTSVIVDGPSLNPWLDDGCGRFKVRHFGVATGSKFSSFSITRKIKEIIIKHRDIKVWNISLGSNEEVNRSFISAEAAVLDQIQFENDVVFVIAGTNKPHELIERIGSPADSINSLVVNSVTINNVPANYSRKGTVLSFFGKPDVSYYGGSADKYINVCEPLGPASVAGTSFAAPWISRKMSYLIDVLGFNREIAKALIIDSARAWNDSPSPDELSLSGHGIVPIKINDIIQTKKDEIRFFVSDISEKWNTYNYNFPIPLQNNKYPYIARATMCYFPMCDRAQGVDYTNTELNIKFGRIKDDGTFNDIKGDTQNLDELSLEKHYLLEDSARRNYRKWDNVKYVAEKPSTRNQAKISYSNKNWGLSIKTNNRLNPADGIGVRFGVVVTLKEINGINRIDEFIKNCHLNGWLVNEIDIATRINVTNNLNEEIKFE